MDARRKDSIKGSLILLIGAIIWGFAFAFQDVAADLIGAFTLNGIRTLIGAITLLPVVLIRSKGEKKGTTKTDQKNLIIAGISCGVLLCIATNIQQFGIAMYPDTAAASGRSGFITALYVVLVPLLGMFFKKKVGINVWISVALSVIGLYLLCFANGVGQLYSGDFVVMCCALAFCFQIMCIDSFGEKVDGVKLAALEFFVCGVLSLVLMFIFENPNISDILSAWKAILYLGIFSTGVAYTFQIIGQQYSKNPTVASIIMSFESVFAVIGGSIMLGERMTRREGVGCIIMLVAIILSQFPQKSDIKDKK